MFRLRIRWMAAALIIAGATLTVGTARAAVVADSFWDFSAFQGFSGWAYGYYDRTADADAIYQMPDFQEFIYSNPNLPGFDYNDLTSSWDYMDANWVEENPPWTQLDAMGGHPNGTNNVDEQWVVRRWVTPSGGNLQFNLGMETFNTGNTNARVYYNGELYYVRNLVGVQPLANDSFAIENVQIGATFDFMIDPNGPDRSDWTDFTIEVDDVVTTDNIVDGPVRPPEPPEPPLADSIIDFSGTQGQDSWFYGYYNRTLDIGNADLLDNLTYQAAADFIEFPAEMWDGGSWNMETGPVGPWTTLTDMGGHPNGTNSAPGEEHWAIRRWEAEETSDMQFDLSLEADNPSNTGNINAHIYRNGELWYTRNLVGVDPLLIESFAIRDIQQGDIFDFIIDPNGPDGSDGTTFAIIVGRDITTDNILDGPVQPPLPPLAYSLTDFSGTQGENGWFYGFYNRTQDVGNADPAHDATYQAENFIEFPAQLWTGSMWDMETAGTAPWTELTATGGHPNGTNWATHANPIARDEHWAVRRWEADVSGDLQFDLEMGTTGYTFARVYRNGELMYFQHLQGGNPPIDDSFGIEGVETGDVFDFVIDPVGNDGADGTTFTIAVVEEITTDNILAGAILAHSIMDFSLTGTQGEDNWFYGYHDVTANGEYEADPAGLDEFIEFPPEMWTGTAWDMQTAGDQPWTFIGTDTGHPNGDNWGDVGGSEHWAIRRWVSDEDGTIDVQWHLAKQNAAGGNGVTGRIFLNGEEVDWATIGGTDGVGVRQNVQVDVQAGDYIDIALSPEGLDGTHADGSDGSFFWAVIRSVITGLSWDGSEANWADLPSHWTGGAADVIPDATSSVAVNSGIATIVGDATAGTVQVGDGQIVVDSTGSLTATSISVTPEGAMSIAGTLSVENLSAGGSVEIGAGGSLQATGLVEVPAGGSLMIGGPAEAPLVDVSGTLSLAGDAAAVLTVGDNVNMQPGSVYAATISGDSAGKTAVAGDFEIGTGTTPVEEMPTLEFKIDGKAPFKAGTYTLITADGEDGIVLRFGSASGLGQYVSTGDANDGLNYDINELTVTIDKDLNPGDADLSAATDLSDFNIWNANKFTTGTDWTLGDFNGDGTTDLSDFNIWNAHKFTVATGGAAPAPTEVPEPGTLALLIVAATIACIHRLRRRFA